MPKKAPSKSPNSKASDLAIRLLASDFARHKLRPGARVGVAVSGGADSVALLLLLLELREKLGIVLSVVHFNHKLRGRASDADEKFVAKLAARHALSFFVDREDISSKAKRERANLEEVARRAQPVLWTRSAVPYVTPAMLKPL